MKKFHFTESQLKYFHVLTLAVMLTKLQKFITALELTQLEGMTQAEKESALDYNNKRAELLKEEILKRRLEGKQPSAPPACIEPVQNIQRGYTHE